MATSCSAEVNLEGSQGSKLGLLSLQKGSIFQSGTGITDLEPVWTPLGVPLRVEIWSSDSSLMLSPASVFWLWCWYRHLHLGKPALDSVTLTALCSNQVSVLRFIRSVHFCSALPLEISFCLHESNNALKGIFYAESSWFFFFLNSRRTFRVSSLPHCWKWKKSGVFILQIMKSH